MNHKEKIKTKKTLNLEYLNHICESFNSSSIFTNLDEFTNKNFSNLFNSVVFRLRESAKYINNINTNYLLKSNSEFNSELILYFHHYFQIYNGIKIMYENILKKEDFESNDKNFFSNAISTSCCSQKIKIENDNAFLEYIRSLTFIHPFETSKRGEARTFMKESEIHTSDWYCVLLLDNSTRKMFSSVLNLSKEKEYINIHCYSNHSGIFEWLIPFDSFQDFIFDKWEKLKNITEEMFNQISIQNKKWQQIKCNRSITETDKIKAFKDISSILKSRFIDAYDINTIISYFSTKITISKNLDSVNEFLNDIWGSINLIRDCVDNLEYEKMDNILSNFVRAIPKNTHPKFMYQMEKIHTYLDGQKSTNLSENQKWGLIQAENFSESFAKKYVIIKPLEMEFDEIILLTDTACYLEAKYNGYLYDKTIK